MNASSDDLLAALGKVNSRQISHLLKTVAESELKTPALTERRYVEHARHYRETLATLVALGWLEEEPNAILLTVAGAQACTESDHDASLRAAVLAALIRSASPFALPLSQYIRCFQPEAQCLIHRPSLAARNDQKPLRDLLIDLRVVSYRRSDDAFVLTEPGYGLYFWARNHTSVSQASFAAAQRKKQEIGYAAELIAFSFEKKRLGPALADRVTHVSSDAPFACFDIKSITTNEGELVDRYIEVKAVPQSDMRFYWSKTEVETSRLLGDKYYLYLVPYVVGQGLAATSVTMLCNPQLSVLEDPLWHIEEDALICSRKMATAPSDSERD
ncbi:MAG: DUF3883 domain-containing protein [Deltaproteobacteria bacterium]|nr:DUF3883 domain-containing protein [Deltaproteobacteria bacterium]